LAVGSGERRGLINPEVAPRLGVPGGLDTHDRYQICDTMKL
jgi:hypothetical protein